MRAEPRANGADLGTKQELLMFFILKAKTITFHHFFFHDGIIDKCSYVKNNTFFESFFFEHFLNLLNQGWIVSIFFASERVKQTERKRGAEVQDAI